MNLKQVKEDCVQFAGAERPSSLKEGKDRSTSTTTIKLEGCVDYSVQRATQESGNSQKIQITLEVPQNTSSDRFYRHLAELAGLHARKQSDYGSDADPFANVRASEGFGVAPWIGALIRLNDKVVRLKSFARKGSLANESAEDSIRDIAVYALIALCLYEEEGMEKYHKENEEFDSFMKDLEETLKIEVRGETI